MVRVTLLTLLLGLIAACTSAQPVDDSSPTAAATGTVALALTAPDGGEEAVFHVYDAADPEARRKGLMNVSNLPAQGGMLFRFPGDSAGGFWMKDTLLPLSIAFAQADGTVLAVLDMEPCRADPCGVYNPGVTYRYALEVAQGDFDAAGVRPGWRMHVPPQLPPAR